MKIKAFIILFVFSILFMFLIWEKNYLNQLNYELQDIIKNINELEEKRNDLLIEKGRLLDLNRIKNIAVNKIAMKEIPEKNFVILKIDKLK
jgi:cell division protein FtsL